MKPQFIVDEKGNLKSVILSIEDYDKLLTEAAKGNNAFSTKERFPLRGKPIHYEQPFSSVELYNRADAQ